MIFIHSAIQDVAMVINVKRQARILIAALLAFSISAHSLPVQADDKIMVSAEAIHPIAPEIYGINYDWNAISGEEYPAYVAELKNDIHFTSQRAPAGWDAERYDWDTNTTPGWKNAPAVPGTNIGEVYRTSPDLTIITPSKESVASRWSVPDNVAKTIKIVNKVGKRASTIEIGNEWWLQDGAKKSADIRALRLRNFTLLLAAVIPEIHRVQPEAKIYVPIDWQNLQDIQYMRSTVGENVWALIEGVSVHVYCGTEDDSESCKRVPAAFAQIRQLSGNKKIFASEWNVPRKRTENNFGLAHANEVGLAIGIMAEAGVARASFWPVARMAPSISLLTNDLSQPTAAGMLFGWMADAFRGDMMTSQGSLPAIAAVEDGRLAIFVFSRDQSPHDVSVAISSQWWGRPVEGRVIYTNNADGSGPPHVTNISVKTVSDRDGSVLTFTLNPGTQHRGAGWEIAEIVIGP